MTAAPLIGVQHETPAPSHGLDGVATLAPQASAATTARLTSVTIRVVGAIRERIR